MEPMKLKKCILDKKLPPLTIITGDEAYISIYTEQIRKDFNCIILNNINNYINIKFNKLNLINNKLINNINNININNNINNIVYMVYNDEEFKTNQNLWNIPLENLVLIYDSIDKKSNFYKAYEQNIVVFSKLEDIILKGLIKNRISVKDEDIDWIIKACDSNYFKCLNEVDKIKIFEKEKHQSLFNEFKKKELIAKQDTLGSFLFSNAITNRNKIEALEYVGKIKRENVILELSSIYNSLKNSLLVQSGNQTASQLGMSDKQYNYLSKNKRYTVKELCNSLCYISETLNKIKYGMIDPLDAINLFILECL